MTGSPRSRPSAMRPSPRCTRRSRRPDRLREIERSVTEDKVFKWLLEKNTVEYDVRTHFAPRTLRTRSFP